MEPSLRKMVKNICISIFMGHFTLNVYLPPRNKNRTFLYCLLNNCWMRNYVYLFRQSKVTSSYIYTVIPTLMKRCLQFMGTTHLNTYIHIMIYIITTLRTLEADNEICSFTSHQNCLCENF